MAVFFVSLNMRQKLDCFELCIITSKTNVTKAVAHYVYYQYDLKHDVTNALNIYVCNMWMKNQDNFFL